MPSTISDVKFLIERMRNELVEKDKTVGETAKENAPDMREDTPAAVIVNTALAMRQRWATANPRLKNFKKRYPNVGNLVELKRLVDSMSERDFCRDILGMNIKKSGFWRYQMLKDLLDAFLDYKRRNSLVDDWETMLQWGREVDLGNLERDPLGNIRNVDVATIQNIRLSLGIDTVKPDVHVKNALNFLLDKNPIQFTELISKHTGYPCIELDQIFWYWDKRRSK